MRNLKFLILTGIAIALTSCASSYKKINPKSLAYYSNSKEQNVTLEYKYNLLNGKYQKKESKKDIRVVAVKITNNSDRDLLFGKDFNIVYPSGSLVNLMSTDKVFSELKQQPLSYLWYLLLSPLQFYTYSTNSYGQQTVTSSFPVGLIVGPGLTGGNMLASGGANKNFNTELKEYDILNKVIKKGETVYGIIGIQSSSYDSLQLKIN
jgi:hypothetical protein